MEDTVKEEKKQFKKKENRHLKMSTALPISDKMPCSEEYKETDDVLYVRYDDRKTA